MSCIGKETVIAIAPVGGRNPANHLGCINSKIMGYLPYQLVQDFFHQQYC